MALFLFFAVPIILVSILLLALAAAISRRLEPGSGRMAGKIKASPWVQTALQATLTGQGAFILLYLSGTLKYLGPIPGDVLWIAAGTGGILFGTLILAANQQNSRLAGLAVFLGLIVLGLGGLPTFLRGM